MFSFRAVAASAKSHYVIGPIYVWLNKNFDPDTFKNYVDKLDFFFVEFILLGDVVEIGQGEGVQNTKISLQYKWISVDLVFPEEKCWGKSSNELKYYVEEQMRLALDEMCIVLLKRGWMKDENGLRLEFENIMKKLIAHKFSNEFPFPPSDNY